MPLSKSQSILLRLLNTPGLGPVRINAILETIHPIEDLFDLSESLMRQKLNLTPSLIRAIRHDTHQAQTERQQELMERYQIHCIAITDPDYPPLLKSCYDPPPLLFYRGDPLCLQLPALAIVGTRHPDDYGIRAVERITAELVESGPILIVSGLAEGIDRLAHQTCLDHGGLTAAVTGTGLDIVYPAANKNLMQGIIRQGIVISEHPPGTPPLQPNFPRRNRIISGLTLGTLIIQAGPQSGALITADFALNQNREIFAVPGSIFRSASSGSNALIRDSAAHLITSAQDILNVFPEWQSRTPSPPDSDTSSININPGIRHET
ncbi:MAG: DNA-processing protein DprA [Candidatus Delongbacteria bacterium]|nr:DNA-processing protein DprA [Candidatus Delongbacteria bacterium]